MKLVFTILIGLLAFVSTAHASCSAAALWAAENDYGNDPMKTSTKTLVPGHEYQVSVGRGNAEDGEHVYIVTFTDGTCNPKTASVCDQTQPGSDGDACKK